MSKMASTLLPSHSMHQSRRWEIRSCFLIFLCVLFLLSSVFTSGSVPQAHAAARSHPNPPLSTPSWLHAPVAVKPPDLKQPASGNQNASTVSIPRPHPTMPAPLTVSLTTKAQQLLSRDGTFELDIAAGSVNAQQIQAAGGAILLKVTQLDGGSGGDVSGRVFLGTYQVQLFTAQGHSLTTLVLAHPFTLRYHAPKALQGWLWQDQRVYAIWQPSLAPSASSTSQKAATIQPQAPSVSHLLLAQKDTPTAAIWSVTTNLGATSSASSTSAAGTERHAYGSGLECDDELRHDFNCFIDTFCLVCHSCLQRNSGSRQQHHHLQYGGTHGELGQSQRCGCWLELGIVE